MKLTLRQIKLLLRVLKIYIPSSTPYVEETETRELEELYSQLEKEEQSGGAE